MVALSAVADRKRLLKENSDSHTLQELLLYAHLATAMINAHVLKIDGGTRPS